jgi:hypothetical protein
LSPSYSFSGGNGDTYIYIYNNITLTPGATYTLSFNALHNKFVDSTYPTDMKIGFYIGFLGNSLVNTITQANPICSSLYPNHQIADADIQDIKCILYIEFFNPS